MRFATPATAAFASRRPSRPRRGASRGRPRRAFSLVELLVVVGIIAVLLSLLLPSLRRVREQAKQAACANNLRQIGMAFVAYTRDNGDHFPTTGPREPFAQASSDWIFWEQTGPRKRDLNKSAVAPYLGQSAGLVNVLRCPSDDTDGHAQFFDPPYRFSYVFNLLINDIGGWPDLTTNRIRNPGEKIMLIEEDEHGIGDGSWYPVAGTVDWLAIRHDAYRLPEHFSIDANPLIGQGVVNVQNPGNIDRRGNAAFCDGHCEFTTRRFVEDPMHYDPLK